MEYSLLRHEREVIANDKPDILLTNFMMLELLMTRQDKLDQAVIGNARGLDFLVLDELHTYRGRQRVNYLEALEGASSPRFKEGAKR